MAFDVGELVASVAIDISRMQSNLDRAGASFAQIGAKLDGLQANTSRMEASFNRMGNTLGEVRDDMLHNTIAIESAIRTIPVAIERMSLQSRAGLRVMTEAMEASKSVAFTLNTTISGQLEQLASRVTASTNNITRQFRQMRDQSQASFRELGGGATLGNVVSEIRSLNASLSNTVNRMNEASSASRNLSTNLNGVGNSANKARNSVDSFTSGSMGAIRKLTTDVFFLQMAFQQLSSVLEFGFGQGLKFAAEMENSLIGMAAIYSSSMTLDGKDMSFQQGMVLARDAVDELKKSALTSTASLEELMATYQAILGPATALGMKAKEITEFTTFGVTAVKAMGLKKDQLVQELRSMLTGNITPRSSTVATALGITNEDITNAKSRIDGVFGFLKERMAGFAMAARESENSFTAIWTNIQDGVQQTQEKAFEGLFDKIKQELKLVQEIFFTIERNAQGDIISAKLNEETVNRFRTMSDIVTKVYDDLKSWVSSLQQNDYLMQRIQQTVSGVAELIKLAYDNAKLLTEIGAVIFATSGGIMRLLGAILVYLDKVPEVLEFIKENADLIIAAFVAWELVNSNIILLLDAQLIRLGAGGILGAIKTLTTAILFMMEAFFSADLAAAGFVATITIGMAAAVLAVGAVTGAVIGLIYAFRQAKTEKDKLNMAKPSMGTGAGEGIMFGESTQHTREELEAMTPDAWDTSRTEDPRLQRDPRLEALRPTGEGVLAPKFPSAEDGKKGKGAAKAAKEELQRELAEIDGRLKLLNDELKHQIEEVKYKFAENLISIGEYYASVEELTRQGTQNEINALNEKLKVETDISNREKLTQQVALKEQEMGRENVKILREQAKAYKELDKALAGYEATALERSGDFAGAAKIKYFESTKQEVAKLSVELEYYAKLQRDLTEVEAKRKLQLEASLVTIATTGKTTVASAEMAKIEREQKLADLAVTNRKIALDEQVKNGTITQIEQNELMRIANNELAVSYEKLIEQLERLAANEEDVKEKDKMLSYLSQLKSKVIELKNPLNEFQRTLKDSMETSMANMFEGILKGTKSVSAAFKDMVGEVLNELLRLQLKATTTKIVSGLLGGLMGGLGGGSSFAAQTPAQYSKMIASGWATGGYISGKGNGTSDDIEARLSNGEYVVRASSVSKLGRKALDYINFNGSLPPLRYFADGGYVGEAVTSGKTRSNLPPIKIEVINETPNKVNAKQGEMKFNGTEYVMQMWIQGVSNNVMNSQDMIKNLGGRR